MSYELNAENRMVFSKYRIGDQLVVTSKDTEAPKYCILKSFGVNPVGELLLCLEVVGEQELRVIHPSNAYYTIEKV